MSDKIKIYAGILAALIIFVVWDSVYIVQQTEQAIVLQFGEPVRLVNRLLNLDPPAQEVVLNDKKRLDVDSFTRYRIIDPLKFYQTVRTEYNARERLAAIVNSSVRKILGQITLPELLSQQRNQIMKKI